MKKIIHKINLILEIIFLLLLGIFIFKIIPLKIIPTKYLIIIFIFMVIIIGIFFLLNKSKNNLLKIFHTLLTLGLIILLFIGHHYLNHTLHFMDNISAKSYQVEEYYILVRKDSSYQTIKDIKNQKMAIFSSTVQNYQKILADFNQNTFTENISFSNYQEAYSAFVQQEVECLFISFLEKEILEQEIEAFYEKVRILETTQQKVETNIEEVDKSITEQSFNIFISGIDIYGNISLVSRSDVNMIATVNPVTHQILLTSIPRDYYVKLHNTTGNKDKLTHAGLYGVNMSIETLEDLLNIKIDYYIRVNFTTLINLVNEIGGIDVYVDKTFRAWTNSKCTYQVGTMHLDGKCALAYARERYAYQEGDRHRIQNQQDIVKAILNKVLNSKTLITKYSSILNSFQSSLETNIPTENIYQFIHEQLENMPSWTIEQIRLNGYDSSNYTYSYPRQKLYVMEPDYSTVTLATKKIQEMMIK